MIEKLFGSRTRVKLLRIFLTNPEGHYFVRELSRETGEQINSVRRELQNLEEIGLLRSYEKDKKKFYYVDKEYMLYDEMRALIFKSRMTLEKQFIQTIRNLGAIQYLALSGYFVDDEQMQVDLFIVGNVSRSRLAKLLETFHKQFGTQLRFTVMKEEEYRYRRDVTDKFLYEFLNSKKIVLVDKIQGNK